MISLRLRSRRKNFSNTSFGCLHSGEKLFWNKRENFIEILEKVPFAGLFFIQEIPIIYSVFCHIFLDEIIGYTETYKRRRNHDLFR